MNLVAFRSVTWLDALIMWTHAQLRSHSCWINRVGRNHLPLRVYRFSVVFRSRRKWLAYANKYQLCRIEHRVVINWRRSTWLTHSRSKSVSSLMYDTHTCISRHVSRRDATTDSRYYRLFWTSKYRECRKKVFRDCPVPRDILIEMFVINYVISFDTLIVVFKFPKWVSIKKNFGTEYLVPLILLRTIAIN